MTTVPMTPFQALLAIGVTGFMLSILAGSIVSWWLWFTGNRPQMLAKRPQATVGLIDIIAAVMVLIGLLGVTLVVWRLGTHTTVTESTPAKSASVESTPIESAPVESAPVESTPVESAPSKEPAIDPTRDPANQQEMTEAKFVFSGFAMTAQLVCVILVTGFICTRTGSKPAMLGWRVDRLRSDLLAGLQCFLMVTPLLLILNAILIQWTKIEYEHPIQQMLEKFPWLLGIAFWQASIVAPISEEFAFRSLLIGWFESIHFCKGKIESWIVGLQVHGTPADSGGDADSVVATGLVASIEDEPSCPVYHPPWWPAILSGALFGLAHFSYGVSWLSLVVFGVILGRLYQIRQSLVPVILVHFLFNSMSMLMMAVKLLLPDNLGT
ncbi:MAG: CPBP family intramembrane glutamic endopeptidase [Pirellula sp.]